MVEKVAFVIINEILIKFNLRIVQGNRIIYMYKVPDYDIKDGTSYNVMGLRTKIITVTHNLDKAFEFLKMDKAKVLGCKNIFELAAYMTTTCPYLSRNAIKHFETQIIIGKGQYKDEPDTISGLRKFVNYVKNSQIKLSEFDFYPHRMYAGFTDDIVRAFFNDKIFDYTITKYKKEYLYKEEIENKFNSKKLVTWIPELGKDAELAGAFSESFVNHVTEQKPTMFPDYLVETPRTIIRREVDAFWKFQFTNSVWYKNYIVDGKNNENVLH